MASMWTFALARLAGILVAGLCLGLLFGPIWLWLLAAACLYLAWQLSNLYRLDRWLRLRSQIAPPNIGGIWGTVAGVLIFSLIDAIFNLTGADAFSKQILRGVIIVAAVAFYAVRSKRIAA